MPTTIYDITPEQFHHGFDLLLLAPMLMCRYLCPMLEKAPQRQRDRCEHILRHEQARSTEQHHF